MNKLFFTKGISALICTIQQIISLIKTFRELKKNVDLTTRNFYKEVTKKVFGAKIKINANFWTAKTKTKNNNETEKMAADGEMPKNSKKKNSFFPLEFFDLRKTDDFLFL